MSKDNCVVHAVCTLTVEIPVRASSAKETLEQLYEAAEKEAERIVHHQLPQNWTQIGKPTFHRASVKKVSD